MTDLLSLVRDVAMQLPGAREDAAADGAEFTIEDRPFARVEGSRVFVLDAEGDGAALTELTPGDDPALIEDRVARGWELAAPAGLLEAGGR